MTDRSETSFEHQHRFFVSPSEAGIRIDKLLAARYPSFSRTYFQQLLENGSVRCNGESSKKRTISQIGDEIKVCFELLEEIFLKPESIPLDILFEDEHLIAINKPAGLVVHPAPGHKRGTFVNALLAHCKTLPHSDSPIRPGIVHRLDKDTTGILIAAKTPLAHHRLVTAFATGRMHKVYFAICLGKPQDGLVNAPIGRHPTFRKKMAVVPTGRPASTEFEVLGYDEQISCVLAKPLTGRTHQIRVHLKYLGHPILGDEIYGNATLNHRLSATRQLLHAYRLQFVHPVSHAPIDLTASLPDDLQQRMKGLLKSSNLSAPLIASS